MKKLDKKTKRGPMEYSPRRPKNLIFYIRALIGNREAIEAKNEHPRKEEEQEKKRKKQ